MIGLAISSRLAMVGAKEVVDTEAKTSTPTETVEETVAAESRWRRRQSLAVGLFQEFKKHPVSMLAKQAAYSLLYAVPSILIVVVSLASIVDKQSDIEVTQALEDFIEDQVPSEFQPLFESIVDEAIVETSESTARITALVSLGFAIWGGAGAVGALMFSCNLVYDVRDTRNWFRRTLLKLGLMVIGGVGLILGFVLFTFGQRIGEWVEEETGRNSILVGMLTSSRNWSLVLVFLSLLLLYWRGPDVPLSMRWLVPGTLAATLAVAITFTGLDLILKLSDPGSAYGAASSVLVLLWTLWVMSVIVIYGAVVNAVVARRHDHKMIAYLQRHPEKRPELQIL
jgi:membrane protein